MAFYWYESSIIPDFSTAVAESQADNDSFSVLVWQYRITCIVKLYLNHVVDTDEDDTYKYESYYVSSGGDAIQTPCVSSDTATSYICLVRYSKTNLKSPSSICLHAMQYSDYLAVFSGNIKNSSIYTWHGAQDQSANYYWHGYDDSEQWKIIDGDLPFLVEFPEMHGIDDAPSSLWKIVDGNLPFKSIFPAMHEIDWYPPTLSWLQFAGYTPYRPWPGRIQIPNIVEPIEIPDIDWTKSMQQSFEYYTVDPKTWYDDKQIMTVVSSNHSHDITSDLKGSATLNTTEQLDENYIRTYMVCKQGRYTHRECLGTYLYMTSSDRFDGIKHNYTMTGYTPLVELQEALPPVGYFIYGRVKKGDEAPLVTEEIRKAIVNNTRCELSMNVTIPKPLLNNFVAGTGDNWLQVVNNLLTASSEAKYMLSVDEWGTIMLRNQLSADAMQPKFVFDDGNASILLPEIDTSDDLFTIPNSVELIFAGNKLYSAHKVTVYNDDETSPVSIQKRGREIKRRYTITNIAVPTGEITTEIIHNVVEAQAYTLLEALSTVNKTISFSHGYCGSKVGDCILINYERAGIENIKAVISSQKVNCTPGCQVDETAVYTKKYWRRPS